MAYEAIDKLWTSEEPRTSWIGIALVTSSVIGMPMLGIAKRRLADKLGSVATRGEGKQNLLCAYLAAAVLVGLLGNALFGLWVARSRCRARCRNGRRKRRSRKLAR